jgi:hypothetical protein
VAAEAEGEMLVRVALDVEAERVVKDRVVAVGRRIEEGNAIAGGDGGVAQPVVLACRPQEMFDRRHPAQHLLDGAFDLLRIGPEF